MRLRSASAPKALERLSDRKVEIDRLAVDLDPARLEPRHVENVGDHAKQERAALVDVAAIAVVFLVAERAEGAGEHQLREADDGVERRPELVRDVGEELRLDAVGVLRLLLLHRVFLGELDQLLRLLLQLLARAAEIGDGLGQRALVLQQLAFLLLERGDVGADRDEAAVVRCAAR